ncbi:MAG: carboxypeptidase regulatory-like domain-containing protein [Deltaproteobacteria bacterium]|nr:carboxypeptidase regulatory-like domain-containing protein [Deltaproteobacteria bacterium]MBI4373501.1 carboxypeptidase regulatory-like domain-containing protein [Deltaproteobacteria bacterium]
MKNQAGIPLFLLTALLMSGSLFAQAGTIKGVVKFSGTAPAASPLKRQADPFCAKTPMNDETVLVNPNGTLKNVAVRIKGAIAGAPASSQPVVTMDQNSCMYRPRVVVLGPGQKLAVKNSDPVLHNVHCYQETKTCFNQAQMKGSKDIEKDLGAGIYKMKCDVHPWMTGYVIANESPFVAVTGDSGDFTLSNVPAGTYTVEAWHEKYGMKTAQVTVAAGAAAAADFAFAAQ